MVAGSNPTETAWELWQFLLEETLKAVGPFYLVSMPGEVKDPTRGGGGGVNVLLSPFHNSTWSIMSTRC